MQQRYYDPAVGRFLSVDPAASDMQTGWNFNRYNYGANSPYRFTDPDGREIRLVADATQADISAYEDAYQYLDAAGVAENFKALDKLDEVVFVQAKPGSGLMQYDAKMNTITWDPESGLRTTENGVQTPALQLGHEVEHALGDLTNTMGSGAASGDAYDNDEERRVIDGWERDAAQKLGEPVRVNHRGEAVPVDCSTCTE